MLQTDNNPLICIVGPTACGKTNLAVNLSQTIDAEIISVDSRQVYRGMDIGTGKDLQEYIINGQQIPYHLIDIVEAGYQYNVFEYRQDFDKAYQQITQQGKKVVCCGGTGMYIEAILKGYRLEQVDKNEEFRKQCENKTNQELIEELQQYKNLHNVSDTSDRERLIRALEIEKYYRAHQPKTFPQYKYYLFYIDISRELLRNNIAKRLQERLQNGMIEEVEKLIEQGISIETLKYYGLEYKFIAQYLSKEIDFSTMQNLLQIAIGQFAKRQQTWFKKMEKNGFLMNKIPFDWTIEKKLSFILDKIK